MKDIEWMRSEGQKEKYKILIMLVLLGICCFVTYYFHVILETGTVFSHFFYVPIILAALWWRRRGLVVAIFLAALLVFSHFFIRANAETINDLIRAFMFMVVVFAVSVSQGRILQAKEKQMGQLGKMVDERTKELMDEKNYVRHLIEGSPDIQMTLDKDGRIMDVNKAFEELVGKNRDDVIDTLIYEYFPKGEAEKFIAEIFEKGKVRNIKLTADIAEKDNIIYNFSGTMFTTSEGRKGIYASGRDITEQGKQDEKLREELENLEKYKAATVGREMRIIELKNKIEKLEEKLKEERKKYGKI